MPLGEAARSAIAAATRQVRERDWPVRWTGPDTWHLTVKFYGERDPSEVDPITAGLTEAALGTPPLDLHFGQLGANGRGRRARVIWVEVGAPPGMELLHHRVELAGERIGIELDGRPFRPHLTLGRVRDGRQLPPEADDALAATSVDVAFLAEELVLYRSELGTSGPTHTALRTWRLEAA